MPYLKQCKVPPSSSKKNLPNVQKEKGGEVKGVLKDVKKNAKSVNKDIPKGSMPWVCFAF